MKNMLAVAVLMLVLVVGCSAKVDVIGTWVTSENSKFEFKEDGTCIKEVNYIESECTYLVNGGVLDIEFPDGEKESGQITSKQLVIGSDLYEREK